MTIVTFDASAKKRFSEFLKSSSSFEIRLGISNKGCGGYSYYYEVLGYGARDEDDLLVEELPEGRVYVRAQDVEKIIGTTVSWVGDGISGRFDFNNPNAVASCGCGASFKIE